MKPTILEGDRVVVNKLAYDLKIPFTSWQVQAWADPTPGEIVTFYSPKDEKLLIKRVIGTPGDVISMRNNQLFFNNKPATYGLLDTEMIQQLDLYQRHHHSFFFEQLGNQRYPVMMRPSQPNGYNSFGPVEVPEGFYLMLGDNRDNSADFRAIGLVPREKIVGRAHTVAFSVDMMITIYRAWIDLFALSRPISVLTFLKFRQKGRFRTEHTNKWRQK